MSSWWAVELMLHDGSRFPPASKPGRGLCSNSKCCRPAVVDLIPEDSKLRQLRAWCAVHAGPRRTHEVRLSDQLRRVADIQEAQT